MKEEVKMGTKNKILIVDDSPINRSLLIDILSPEYDVIEAENGLEAIGYIEKNIANISLVLLDIVMPVMDGFEVLMMMNKNNWIQYLPVITITSDTAFQSINKAYDLGVCDYINRPFDALIVQKRVQNTILLNAKQKQLENMVTEQILEKEKNNLLMIEILSHIVEFRNGESGMHVLRIRIITEFLMRSLSKLSDSYHFSDNYIAEVMNASSLHDIGKTMISDTLLNKTGKLNEQEFEIMKQHTFFGAQILKDIPYFKNENLIQTAYDICRWHHERYDGCGYPDHLIGDEIPISAQVVALADVYDALTSERAYKPPYSHEKAIEMIMAGQCGAFNPELLDCLSQVNQQLKERLRLYVTEDSLLNLESQSMNEHLFKKANVSNRTLTLLEQERTKYKFFASLSGEIQFEFNVKSHILTISEWGAMHLELPEIIFSPIENQSLREVVSSKSLMEFQDKVKSVSVDQPNIELMTQIKVKDDWRWFKILARPLWIGDDIPEITDVIGKCVDVHDEYTKIKTLKKIAGEDSLTKLSNHKTARQQIEMIMSKHLYEQYAMVLIDLDYFKNANDFFGHMFGDEVLRYFSKKLIECLGKKSIISRVGGDEFMVFMKYEGNVEKRIKDIHDSVSCRYKDYPISLSMGIALYPRDGSDYETIYKHADQALYIAKKSGRKQYSFYHE